MIRNAKIRKILSRIINYQIRHGFAFHADTFKKGDIVTWNWKAKIEISTVTKRKNGFFLVNKVTKHKEGASLEWINGDSGGDAFWYRKKYFFETVK